MTFYNFVNCLLCFRFYLPVSTFVDKYFVTARFYCCSNTTCSLNLWSAYNWKRYYSTITITEM